MTGPAGTTSDGTVLDIQDLRVYFYTRSGVVRAVDGIDLEIRKGEAVGLVGESGSGKSQTALAVIGLTTPPGRVVSGRIIFNGEDLRLQSPEAIRKIRGRDIAMIFQDPMSSLNPVLRVGEQVADGMRVHQPGRIRAGIVFDEMLGLHRFRGSARKVKTRVIELFRRVRIPDARRRARSFPHEFSGGLRQRVMIAAGLAWSPSLLIADEPTTALDVTIEAQVLGLIAELRRDMNMGLLLITHDIGLVAENCDRVYVMYAGQIVEEARVRDLFTNPKHPYTQGLLASTPDLDEGREWLVTMKGSMPDLTEPFPGCAFYDRCPHRLDPRCATERPPLQVVSPHHRVACFYDPPEVGSGKGQEGRRRTGRDVARGEACVRRANPRHHHGAQEVLPASSTAARYRPTAVRPGCKGLRRCKSDHPVRRDPWTGRRVGVGQDDRGPVTPGSGTSR